MSNLFCEVFHLMPTPPAVVPVAESHRTVQPFSCGIPLIYQKSDARNPHAPGFFGCSLQQLRGNMPPPVFMQHGQRVNIQFARLCFVRHATMVFPQVFLRTVHERAAESVQLRTVVTHGNARHAFPVHGHQRIPVTILRILAFHQQGHHVPEVVNGAAFSAETHAAFLRHGHHDQPCNFCCLLLPSLFYLNHTHFLLWLFSCLSNVAIRLISSYDTSAGHSALMSVAVRSSFLIICIARQMACCRSSGTST